MPYTAKRPVPPDADADAAWSRIMQLARDNALILQAYGGTAMLATPAAQREGGIRDRVLRAGLFELESGGNADADD